MSGIYIHIPFCKQACHYCDFHFSTNNKTKSELINAILQEIALQRDYLGNSTIETLYFGGGTPTLLDENDLLSIIKQVQKFFTPSLNLEMTIEANPDDLNEEKLEVLKKAGFNRLSIGIQSFNDKFLTFFNRAHNSKMALESVKNAKFFGFDNISIDLIFGSPNQSLIDLKKDLTQAVALNPSHISIYGLTIEQKTVFGKLYQKGKLNPLDEDLAAQQFEFIMKFLTESGYHQYEISNFSKPKYESKHNSSYWEGKKYLGIGPSAHSFNGDYRQYNISNNINYIKSIRSGKINCEKEKLTKTDKINEQILIQLRTFQGINLSQLSNTQDYELTNVKKEEIKALIDSGKIEIENGFLRLTNEGKLLADFIIEKLII